MAITTLILAIIGAATGVGSLFWQLVTWKRSGWVLDVAAYWDSRTQKIVAEITNTGRQECVISELRYFVEPASDDLPDVFISDYDPLPAPLAGSDTKVLTKSLAKIPSSFTLEVWAWTGGKPYKSEKYTVTDSAHRPIGPPGGSSS